MITCYEYVGGCRDGRVVRAGADGNGKELEFLTAGGRLGERFRVLPSDEVREVWLQFVPEELLQEAQDELRQQAQNESVHQAHDDLESTPIDVEINRPANERLINYLSEAERSKLAAAIDRIAAHVYEVQSRQQRGDEKWVRLAFVGTDEHGGLKDAQ